MGWPVSCGSELTMGSQDSVYEAAQHRFQGQWLRLNPSSAPYLLTDFEQILGSCV